MISALKYSSLEEQPPPKLHEAQVIIDGELVDTIASEFKLCEGMEISTPNIEAALVGKVVTHIAFTDNQILVKTRPE